MERYHGLKGKDELLKRLSELGGDVTAGATGVLKSVGQDTAKAIKDEIPEAPVQGEPSKPGAVPYEQDTREHRKDGDSNIELKRSIRWQLMKQSFGNKLTVRVFSHFPGISKTSFYAYMIEWGTSKMPARPFFWPAIMRMVPKAQDQIKEHIAKAIRRFNGAR